MEQEHCKEEVGVLLSLEFQQPLAPRGSEGIFGCLEIPVIRNSCLPQVLCEDQGDPQGEGAKI